jgi:hypothetical protein
MSNEISLQGLIEKVKTELLAPASAPGYPVFFIDKVELELQVNVSAQANGEIGIAVLDFAKAGVSASNSQEKSHTIKVTLSPILTREEQRALLEKDEKMMNGVQRATQAALRKTGLELADE